jgi:lysyl endopeptidase
MPVNEVSSWGKTSLLLSFAVLVLSACMPSNRPALTEEAAFAETLPPQTSVKDMENSSSTCRIRDEVPAENLTTLRLPELDVQALQGGDQNLPKDAPQRFATTTQVDINPATYGRWESTVDDLQVWRLRIIAPQALSLSLGFTSFDLPAGGCLFIYSPDHNQVLGPYTINDNAEHGQLWTPTVDGEEVVIEVSVPKEYVSRMQLVLGSINQGYKK